MDPGFDPSGKRIAVVGTDAAAGHHLGRLAHAAASVTVFRPRTASRRQPRCRGGQPGPNAGCAATSGRPARPSVAIASSAIEAVTASGVRTGDGVDHRVDTIIYGTGFSIPDVADETLVGAGGLPIRRPGTTAWSRSTGWRFADFPTTSSSPDPIRDAQARYVVECLKAMERTGSGRIEVRASSQQVFNERAQLRAAEPPPVASAFDLFGQRAGA